MAIYNYPAPCEPQYKKPTSVKDCLPQAKELVKRVHGRAALGLVKKGDRILIVTYPDQDEYVKEALTQAFREEGAQAVDFILGSELSKREAEKKSVEDGWKEGDRMENAPEMVAGSLIPSREGEGLYNYLVKHPEVTGIFWGTGGRGHRKYALRDKSDKFRNNWLFNNWEEFLSKTWVFPQEVWIEFERRIIEAIGKASIVRITDPQGTYLEFSLTAEEAKRWQNSAWRAGHLFLDPFQATSKECSVVPVSTNIPPVFPGVHGVLAGTANHYGFFPHIEVYFEHGRLVEVKGGGKYGEVIRNVMDKYKWVHWPGYPEKGLYWFCDSVVCTSTKAFRRKSDMFGSYWKTPNSPERNRTGVFHHGFGSRMHGEDYIKYAKEHDVPTGHIHVHNYFVTYEIKLHGTNNWYKIVDKGRVTALDDPEIRALAVKYGDPDEILSYDWVPPLPGINCEGDYFKDYAPDPMAYLKKRMKEGKPI